MNKVMMRVKQVLQQGQQRYRYVLLISLLVILLIGISMYWSHEPAPLDMQTYREQPHDIGYVTTSALIDTLEGILHKPGGYLSNDKMSPALVMDNILAFEFGALEQIRDFALSLRSDFSRSQSQSAEEFTLAKAQPKLNIDHRSWFFPSAESEYEEAIGFLKQYRQRILNVSKSSAQFYARADNLSKWLQAVNQRLGSLSQRLSSSVPKVDEDMGLAGAVAGRQTTHSPMLVYNKTSWLEIDDVFYEARGSCWALLNFMKAIEVDFQSVLRKKNAEVSLKQIIRELEATQTEMSSMMVLNGSGFGMFANHSLVMANYISRANAAVIDLKNLLSQG